MDDEVIMYVKEKAKLVNSNYNSDEFINKYYPENIFYGLDISLSLEDIIKIFNERNYVQLRQYKGEKILVIGCGNRRLDAGNLLPDIDNIENIIYKRNFDITHFHHNEFTIDLTLTANPSIIGNFNAETKFLTIPDNSFNLIYFEGGGDPDDNICEIKRLLDSRTTSFCIRMDKGIYKIHSNYENGVFKLL